MDPLREPSSAGVPLTQLLDQLPIRANGQDLLRCTFVFGVLGLVSWKIWKRIISYALLPAQLVHKLRRDTLEADRSEFLQKYGGQVQRITIKDIDVELDGIEIVGNSKERAHKYIVMMNANGVCYEDMLDDAYEYAKCVNCKAILFNYRGVGQSTSWPRRSSDIVQDGVMVIQWLLTERNVKETDIVIHGHSIGGAVGGLALNELRVASTMIADRTFANLLDIVAKICGTSGMLDTSIIGAIIMGYSFTAFGLGYRLGISDHPIPYLSPVAWILTAIVSHRILSSLAPNESWPLSPEIIPTFKYPKLVIKMLRYSICGLIGCFPFAMAATINALSFRSMHGLIELLFSGISIGFLLGFHGYLKTFGRNAVKLLGWDMNTGAVWNSLQGRKAILFHDWDSMIPTPLNIVQSDHAFRMMTGKDLNSPTETQTSNATQTDIIQLMQPCQPAHMYPLMAMAREKSQVIQFVKNAFNSL